jgi:hypothetical protein
MSGGVAVRSIGGVRTKAVDLPSHEVADPWLSHSKKLGSGGLCKPERRARTVISAGSSYQARGHYASRWIDPQGWSVGDAEKEAGPGDAFPKPWLPVGLEATLRLDLEAQPRPVIPDAARYPGHTRATEPLTFTGLQGYLGTCSGTC